MKNILETMIKQEVTIYGESTVIKELYEFFSHEICKNDLEASKNLAACILNSNSILDKLIIPFLSIPDAFQNLRIGWILGKQVVKLSSDKTIFIYEGYSLDDHIYNY